MLASAQVEGVGEALDEFAALLIPLAVLRASDADPTAVDLPSESGPFPDFRVRIAGLKALTVMVPKLSTQSLLRLLPLLVPVALVSLAEEP